MIDKKIFLPDDNLLPKNIKQKLDDVFDVNFAVSEIRIDTMESFNRHLLMPFLAGGNSIYYRGERVNDNSRRLIPTFLRSDKPVLKSRKENIFNLSGKSLYDFYIANEPFYEVYKTLYGEPEIKQMYNMTAFAQHYLDISPFIDFSKSLYVAVSFALKGRKTIDNDFVIYTVFDIGDDDTTSDLREVNYWLENYNINIVKTATTEDISRFFIERQKSALPDIKNLYSNFKKIEDIFNGVSPTAKLIDIPTNDLMKYQQGVFLLLNDFSLVDSQYLTKAVRQSFVINKYVISKNLCNELNAFILKSAPQYRYECLMNIAKAVKG